MDKREFNDQVEGRNAVLELLESDRDINKIFISDGEKHGSINKIIALAKEKKVIINEVSKNKLNQMSQTENNQGVIAIVPPFNYCEIDDILDLAKNRNEKPFVLILDGIEDPHNLGSIIRTAETAGVHGIIIPKRRAANVNSTVAKVSAGAVEYMKIARVNNINDAINTLKENDIWICGTDMNTDKYYYDEDFTGGIGIVIGSEGYGMSRLVKENCDFLVKIPMKGKITSLNASVSAGIVMYEVVKQRIRIKNNPRRSCICMKSKKKILLIIIPIVIILIIAAIIAVLYFTTDLFKSNEELFWKYFAKNQDVFDVIKNDKQAEQSQFKTNNSYTSDGNLSLVIAQGENSSKQLDVVTTARHDVNTSRTYADATLKNGDIDLFKASYINSGDIYAVSCDEIFQGYVGTENSGLTQLAANFGIENFPDSINVNEYTNLLDVTDEEWAHISETYLPVIMNVISEESYTKSSQEIQVNGQTYNANIYGIQITGENLKQLIINGLTTLRGDTQTLVMLSNKLSTLGLGIEYTDTSNLALKIDELIDNMQNVTIEDNLYINVYENNGEVIRTEINLENTINLVYDRTSSSSSLTIDLIGTMTEQEIIDESIDNTNITDANNMSGDVTTYNANNETDNTATNENVVDNEDTIVSMENTESMNTTVEENVNGNSALEGNSIAGENNGITDSSDEVIDLSTTQDKSGSSTRIVITKNNTDNLTTNTIEIVPDSNIPNENITITINMSNVQNDSINNSYEIVTNTINGEQTETLTITYDNNTIKADQVEEIPELTGSNTAIASNYDANTFNTFLTNWANLFMNKLSEKLTVLGF